MKLAILIPVAALLAAQPASADFFKCGESAPRRVTAPVAGVSRIVVVGRAGSLKITGQPGASSVSASGTACSSDRDALNDIQLVSRRDGSDLRIEAIIPEKTMIFGWYEARLDFEVVVPSTIPLQVTDGSGSAEIRGTGALEVVDGSGELSISGTRGNVEVKDGSGQVTIRDVAGNVEIIDGSGGIEIEGVTGSVRITDGSGGIEVADVRGDLTVADGGSGGIDYERVSGRVRVPERH